MSHHLHPEIRFHIQYQVHTMYLADCSASKAVLRYGYLLQQQLYLLLSACQTQSPRNSEAMLLADYLHKRTQNLQEPSAQYSFRHLTYRKLLQISLSHLCIRKSDKTDFRLHHNIKLFHYFFLYLLDQKNYFFCCGTSTIDYKTTVLFRYLCTAYGISL